MQSEVKLPNGDKVPGSGPIVIIGPNGVGKTRLGVAITQANDAERVAALRSVEVGGIPIQRFEQANLEVQRAYQEIMKQHWRQSYEISSLLSEILVEDRDSAPDIRFVYITHDIPFALSRSDAQFAIARSESTAELLPSTSSIPSDVVAQVLGAASFSIKALRDALVSAMSPYMWSRRS